MNRFGTVFGILLVSAAGLTPGYVQIAGGVFLAHAILSTVAPHNPLLGTSAAVPRRFGMTGDGVLVVFEMGTDGGVTRVRATENFPVQLP